MKLTRLTIENFKCIDNTNEFSIDPVTSFVGKNEAGKTAMLQALYKLKPVVKGAANFELLEYPRRRESEYMERHKTDPDNVLTAVWKLEPNDITFLSDRLGEKALKGNEVTVRKGYENVPRWGFEVNGPEVVAFLLSQSGLIQEEIDVLQEAATVGQLVEHLQALEEPTEQQTAFLEHLQTTFPNGDLEKVVSAWLYDLLPTFLYFGEYQAMPGNVSITDLRTKQQNNTLSDDERVFLALLDLVGTTADDIDKIGVFEELQARLEGIQNRITDEIFEYWTQNRHLKVQFLFADARPQDPPPFNQGYVFRTRIENTRHRVTIGFDERSTGFVWFFSFLVWFSQIRKVYGENIYILLDEPGLGLHAKAQADLLRYIDEKLAPHYQVIYTAHSPFMINPDKLLSARTVEDVVIEDKETGRVDVLGTKVGDEVFSTDPDTIFPLQAALGYDITQTLFVGEHTLLVEGPSDLLYIRWFSQELQREGRGYLDPRWVIAPSGGVSNITSFVALFGANKLHVAVFSDFHAPIKQKVRDLRESELLRAGHVFSAEMYVDQGEADIEDLLGRSLYVKIVNECYSLSADHKIPGNKPSDAPERVLKEVEDHFRVLPEEIPEFDHMTPALYLMEHSAELRPTLPYLEKALNRFEELFIQLNGLL